jgi:glucose-1-phosphate thymidylyltransferase
MKNFKGIILAGGRGSRLSPLTDITNKFLMPVYDKLMIEYSVISLRDAGVTDIAIILGTKSAGETMDYLKSGSKYGVKFTYFYQDHPLGVPHALYQAKDWAGDSEVVVMCADNILYDKIGQFLDEYRGGGYITTRCIADRDELKRFAVLDLIKGEIIEKPENPPSTLAFCGIQIYDKYVWGIIEGLEPSGRGEYEIVDVLNEYIRRKQFHYGQLKEAWFDCGNKDALFEAQQFAFIMRKEDKI